MVKKAIYMAGHPGYLNQFIIHKMTVNSDIPGILIYGKIGKLADNVKELVDLDIFEKVIYAFDTMGQLSENYDDCIEKINNYYSKIFNDNEIPISNNNLYYVGVDTLNSYGIFLINKLIPFYYYEGGFSNFFDISKERLHRVDPNIASDTYIQIMDKMGISDGSNPLITILSNIGSSYNSLKRVELFDIKSRIKTLSDIDVVKIRHFYHVPDSIPSGTADLIIMNSQWGIRNQSLEEQQRTMLKMYGIIMDYLVKNDIPIVVKPHPLGKVDELVYQDYFDCPIIPGIFPSECISCLNVDVRNSYTLGSTGVDRDSKTIKTGFSFTENYKYIPFLDIVLNLSAYFDTTCVFSLDDELTHLIDIMINQYGNKTNVSKENEMHVFFNEIDNSINDILNNDDYVCVVTERVGKCISYLWEYYNDAICISCNITPIKEHYILFDKMNIVVVGKSISTKGNLFKYERELKHMGLMVECSSVPIKNLFPREVSQALRDKGGDHYRDEAIDLMRNASYKRQRWSKAELFSMLYCRGTDDDLSECLSIFVNSIHELDVETLNLILMKLRNIGFNKDAPNQKLLDIIGYNYGLNRGQLSL